MEAMKKFKETEYEELIEKVIEWFEDNEEAFNDCIEALDSYNGYLDGDRYFDMDLLDEEYCDVRLRDFLFRTFYGHDEDNYTTDSRGEKHYGEFNPNRAYYRHDGYGNLVSTDYKDYTGKLDSYFVEELISQRKRIEWYINEYDELVCLLDKIEAINDGIYEDEE